MSKYNIPISNVVRHYDASRKKCPEEIMNSKDSISWDKFKAMLNSSNTSVVTTTNVYRIYHNGKQQGTAYANIDNIIKFVRESIEKGANKVEVVKKQ